MIKKYLYLIIAFTLMISIFPIQKAYGEQNEPIVYVKLVNFLGNKTEIILKPNGDYLTSDSNVILKSNTTYLLKQINGKLSLYQDGSLINSYDSFSVRPVQSRMQLSINNRLYLGSFDFIVENNLYVRPINSVYMEDYLKGVVPIEMYPSWNLEALKTQAVAARTYAMSYMNRGIINDTISYQVYGGYVWTPNTSKAVEDTSGQVLQYNGRLIDTVYSASNGGMTETNSNAWGNNLVPYLGINKKDIYDPKIQWNFSFKKTQIDLAGKDLSKASEWWNSVKETDATISNNIKMWLNSNGYANKDIKIISISDFSLHGIGSGGRVSKGDITVNFLVKDMTDSTGKLIPQKISFKDTSASRMRAMIGNRVMLSYLVDAIDATDNFVSVKGFGDGHGVGMSQWGAKYMADAGKVYNEILQFYYTGTDIKVMYQVSEKTVSPSTMTAIKIPVSEALASTDIVTSELVENAEETLQFNTAKDIIEPIIKDLSSTTNNTLKKSSVTYSIDEEAYVTVYVKNSNGTIIKYIQKDIKKAAGKYTSTWDTSAASNGEYIFGIIAKDESNNTASAISKFTINKPSLVKDTTVPKVSDTKISYNNGTRKVTVTYSVNETANVTVAIKNSKGKIIKYLQNQTKKTKGKYSLTWDVSTSSNGSYVLTIVATDLSKNKSSKSLNFNLKKVLTGKINASNVLVRQKATTNSKSIGKLTKNQSVTVISKSGSWYYIQFGNTKGFVYSKYISNVK